MRFNSHTDNPTPPQPDDNHGEAAQLLIAGEEHAGGVYADAEPDGDDPDQDPMSAAQSARPIDTATWEAITADSATHVSRLTERAWHLVGNHERAQDLAQEALTRALEALSRGTHVQPDKVAAWLYRIVTNVTYEKQRRDQLITWLPMSSLGENGQPETLAALPGGVLHPSPEGAIANQELISLALAGMPEKYKVCLTLHAQYGLSGPEIAEMLGIDPATVLRRVAKAKQIFAERYLQAERGELLPAGAAIEDDSHKPPAPHQRVTAPQLSEQELAQRRAQVNRLAVAVAAVLDLPIAE